jgi:uncharacterized protein
MPERMCIVTREVRDEAELVRFVRSPAGEAVPDLQRKLPGRGVWVSCVHDTVAEAVAKGLFSRGFKAQTKAAPELAEQLAKLLRQQAISHLSLARKAGEAVAGFFKVEEALRRGPVRLLFHAAGAGSDGCAKLNRLRQSRTVVCDFLTPDDLDLAFGRTNVVHAAVADGGLAERLLFHVTRLARYDGLGFKVFGSEDEK